MTVPKSAAVFCHVPDRLTHEAAHVSYCQSAAERREVARLLRQAGAVLKALGVTLTIDTRN
jgi:hypothetical protein